VCKLLVEKKYNVVAIVSPFSQSNRLDDIKNKLTICSVNLAEKSEVFKLFRKHEPEVVLHLATHGVYQYQQQDVDRIAIDNYLMSLNLLEASKDYKVKKFVNTGSVFEYGSQKGKVKEDGVNLADILNKYSAVKMATTALTNSYANDFSVITLRPFTAYGVLEDETRFVKSTIKKALNGEEISIVKNVIRDFIYVDDIAEAYLKCVERDFPSGEIVSIGGGKKVTLEEVTILVKKLAKSKSKVVFNNNFKRSKESSCYADITKARKVLGWRPKHSLLLGIKKMIYFQHNGKIDEKRH
jgi:nucleoside-diphosphate-sugar epimerase